MVKNLLCLQHASLKNWKTFLDDSYFALEIPVNFIRQKGALHEKSWRQKLRQ